MKDATSIAVVFVICTIFALLYFFVGQSALNRNNAIKTAELDELIKEEQTVNWMGSQINEFENRLPDLKRRINYYKLAIPSQLEDERFFSHLAGELARHDAELLELQQAGNKTWLGQLSKTDEEKYTAAGLDINAIKQIRTTSFKIRVYGDFNDMLTVLENLKTLGRLYTIDQVISPAGGGGGTVLVDNSGEAAQMEVSGSLFYGIPENYRDAEGLDAKYMEVAVIRNAQELSTETKHTGDRILHGYDNPDESATAGKDNQSSDEAESDDTEAVQSVLLPFGNFRLKDRG